MFSSDNSTTPFASFVPVTESQHTTSSRENSNWVSRMFGWTGKGSIANSKCPHTVEVGRVDVLFPYITIPTEDYHDGKGVETISTKPVKGFMNAFGNIMYQNEGWFHRIISETYRSKSQRRAIDAKGTLANRQSFQLSLQNDGTWWKGSLLPELGRRVEVSVPDEELPPLVAETSERCAYRLLLFDDGEEVIVVFEPVKQLSELKYILSFSLYLFTDCTFELGPFHECCDGLSYMID